MTDIKRIGIDQGVGDPDTATFNLFYGHNHLGTGDAVPGNLSLPSFWFFTKPNCNLLPENIDSVPRLQYLSESDKNSTASMIRASLMPKTFNNGRPGSAPGIRCNAVDDDYPFIPFLSTTLQSMSGWPDEVTEFFMAEPGMKKETFGWVDSPTDFFEDFTLTATFIAKRGHPHFWFFNALDQYAKHVGPGSGVIHPHPESENEHEIDYMMNYYLLITDPTKKYLQMIARPGGGMIVEGNPSSADFNFDRESVFNTENAQYTIPFKCFGMVCNEPETIDDFNGLVRSFKTSMFSVMYRPGIKEEATNGIGLEENYRGSTLVGDMVYINDSVRGLFQWRGYPFINPNTSEIEWWVDKEIYDARLNEIGM